MGIITGILTLYAFGMGGWLAGQGIKSVASSMADKAPAPEPVDLNATRSASGKTRIEKACYYPSMKSYYAKVVCQELQYSWNVWADSKEELEHKVKEEFDRCDERIRECINKREMKKPLYFRIG